MAPNSWPQPLASVLRPFEVAELLRTDPAVRLLDVRTPAEFEALHIVGAYNVPLDTLHEHAREIRTAVSDPIVLVCLSGQRARKAEDALARAGLANLHVLDGGVNGWIGAGMPVRRGAPKICLERQVRIVAGTLAGMGGLLATFAHPAFGLVPASVGIGLAIAGLTDTCGMAMLLARLPYNRGPACDIAAVLRALSEPGGMNRERTGAPR